MAAWADCGDPKLTPEDLIECPCWLALDLGFVSDIASAVKCFLREEPDPKNPDKTIFKTYFFGRHYLPEEAIEDSSNSQYSGWRRMGRIIATDGNVTDLEVILDDVMEDVARYQVQEVLFDPYNKLALLNSLQKRGVSIDQLVEFPP
jgi:phage terminase large subunit-like protein